MASDGELWRVWRDAAGCREVSERLRGLLDEIDQQVNESGFTCQQSGRCCRFETFRHRLFMTGLEVAWFRSRVGAPPGVRHESGGDEGGGEVEGGGGGGSAGACKASGGVGAGEASTALPVIDPKQDGCPYQVDGACGVHRDRPFACRVFFCQEGSDAWQGKRYEAFQLEMKRLHEELGLPYRYMEWRQGLADAEANEL